MPRALKFQGPRLGAVYSAVRTPPHKPIAGGGPRRGRFTGRSTKADESDELTPQWTSVPDAIFASHCLPLFGAMGHYAPSLLAAAEKTNRSPSSVGSLHMPDKTPDLMSRSDLRQTALSRWDNEGGSGPDGAQESTHPEATSAVPELTNTELIQLRVRVITLENVVIALLAGASDRQLENIRERAAYIAPRPGFTQHPLTTKAAGHMIDLVHRARSFPVMMRP